MFSAKSISTDGKRTEIKSGEVAAGARIIVDQSAAKK